MRRLAGLTLTLFLGACSASGGPDVGDLGLATAVVHADGTIEVEVTGQWRADAADLVEETDPWHLGSDTKAMTATLAAMLVADGVLSWDTAASDVLNGVAPGGLGAATLGQLLTHSAGVVENLPRDLPDLWDDLWDAGAVDVPGTRQAAARVILAEPPTFDPGSEVGYANAGYLVAGAMMEAVTGQSWEALMQARLFEPLDLACGFGAPDGDVPWGHEPGSPPTPVEPGPGADNPPALGPAGTVHCDMAGWGAFVREHLVGPSGGSDLLDAETFDLLHTPPAWLPGSDMAYGWVVVERSWGEGKVLTHTGSNTLWTATAWLAPNVGRAFLAATNVGAGERALDDAIGQLIAPR